MKYNLHLIGETNKSQKGVFKMIQQSVMPFKLERTEERITARSGLTLYAEWMRAMDIEGLVSLHMIRPGSGHGYGAIDYVGPLSMMMYGGGDSIDDVREIRDDHALREVIGMRSVPSSSAIGDWLKRMGDRGGIEGMEKINEAITRKALKQEERKSYTLIIDPTVIEAGKREAHMTYLGFRGYRPVVATLRENGLTIAYQFKEGNDNGGRVEIIGKAFDGMPRGKEIVETLLDSEYYTNEVIEYLDKRGVRWAIGADKDGAVLRAIEGIADVEWKPFRTANGDMTDREVSETVHSMNLNNARI